MALQLGALRAASLDADPTQTSKPAFSPGQRWKPQYGGPPSMSRIIRELTPAGVVFDEGWPSKSKDSFDRWSSWADWLTKTGAQCVEEKDNVQP